jgi:hypothetical protein
VTKPKTALVADWLTNMGGAEHLFYSLHKAFPDADIYTSVFDADACPKFKNLNVHTSYLQKLPRFLRNRHQLFPVLRARGGDRRWEREWVTSETMPRYDTRIVTAAPAGDLPIEPKWSDAFVETGWLKRPAQLGLLLGPQAPGRVHPRRGCRCGCCHAPNSTRALRHSSPPGLPGSHLMRRQPKKISPGWFGGWRAVEEGGQRPSRNPGTTRAPGSRHRLDHRELADSGG